MPKGLAILRDPLLNKGTAFTEKERDALGLRGLLPPLIATQEEQVARFLQSLRRLPDDLEKYIALNALHDRNEALFLRVVVDHIDEMQPIIYTPGVGPCVPEVRLNFSAPARRIHLDQRPRPYRRHTTQLASSRRSYRSN